MSSSVPGVPISDPAVCGSLHWWGTGYTCLAAHAGNPAFHRSLDGGQTWELLAMP